MLAEAFRAYFILLGSTEFWHGNYHYDWQNPFQETALLENTYTERCASIAM